MKLKIAYFGTPDFSARFLEKLITDKDIPVEVVLVVTQRDKPVGRKQIVTPTATKLIAQKYNLPTLDQLEPKTYNLLANADLALLYAYGEIISSDLLRAPKHGFWNLHPSLLPKYRGASPMAYPLVLGDKATGVTLMEMDEELDHGPIIAQEKYEILPTDKRPDLETKLTDLGYELFKKYVFVIVSEAKQSQNEIATSRPRRTRDDILQLIQQDNNKATFTRRLTKQDGYIPLFILKKALLNESLTPDELPEVIKEYLSQNQKMLNSNDLPAGRQGQILDSSKVVYNLWRGLFPWPGLWTKVPIDSQEKRLKLTDLELKDDKLIIKKVQLEGKKEVEFETFNKSYKLLEIKSH